MNAFDVFKDYVALKQHFTSKSYDYFKYHGKTRSSTPTNYNQRKDKIFFMKLAKHQDPKHFLVANFVESDNSWIGDLAYNELAQENYIRWSKRIQSLSYFFKEEIKMLDDDFDSNFIVKDGQHPHALKLFLSKQISIETLVILIDIVRCFSHWQKHMQDDFVWKDLSHKLVKYKPFLNYDRVKMKEILLAHFKRM
jgi:hypothetical protein